jgi:hypothetical protein
MAPPTRPSTTSGTDRIDEVLEVMRDLIRSLGGVAAPSAASTGISSEQQRALFAYQWIAGHLGRSDVVPPIVSAERQKGVLILLDDPRGATHAFIVGADGAVEEVVIPEDTPRAVPLGMRDDVAIAYVELRTEHGAPVAIVHPLAGL